ncbi:hypothetical protein CDL15_Pgr006466 [Punica granatum]|uniref:Uncharacterized protein n=1 Tax=Punica granatum TaxID=22663 RepID=A0A218XYE1_PUNGR|nr:hypothetical protein CDL15_Pgr006466 [Punica granatum]
MHIWTSLHQVDRDYIATFVDDFTLLATRRVDWSFLVATITFWSPIHAIFSIQGIEFTPTIEEYQTLISRIAVTRGIVELNLHTNQPTLVSHLLGVQRSQFTRRTSIFR